MVGCNGSAPEEKHSKVRAVLHGLHVAAASGWRWGILPVARMRALQSQGSFVSLRRYASRLILLLCVGFVLWLTWYVPYWFPRWGSASSHFFTAHTLFMTALCISVV